MNSPCDPASDSPEQNRSRRASTDRRARLSVAGHKELHVAMLGPKGVGKSALCVRYLTKRFIGEYGQKDLMSTRVVSAEGKPVQLHLLDMCSDSSYVENYLGWADAIFIVFSITDHKSFLRAQEIARELLSMPNSTIPTIMLLGNKSDLKHLRQVSATQAVELAGSCDCQYMETSASESPSSVESAFTCIFREIIQKHKNEKKSSGTHQRLLKVKQTLRNLTDFRGRTNTL